MIGNIDGVVDHRRRRRRPRRPAPVNVINNDFAFNTIGLLLEQLGDARRSRPTSPATSSGRTTTRRSPGTASRSSRTNPNKITLRNNLFYGNGASDDVAGQCHQRPGQRLQPGRCWARPPQDAINNLGNFVGNPAFVFPIDPRPGSDGPANFFLDADFQLTAASAAIDNAWEATAIPTDLLGNSQVKITGGGFGLPGYGPRDIGAFEFNGTGGDPVGGAFRVVTTSLVPVAGAAQGQRRRLSTSPRHRRRSPSPSRATSIPADITATDLVLSGSAVNRSDSGSRHQPDLDRRPHRRVQPGGPVQPRRARSTSRMAPGTIESTTGSANLGYSDNVVLSIGAITPPVGNPTPQLRRLPDGPVSTGHAGHPGAGADAGTERPKALSTQEEGPRCRASPEAASSTSWSTRRSTSQAGCTEAQGRRTPRSQEA